MHKMWIVFKREYLVRVRKKTFILATILVPLAIAAIGVGAGFISYLGAKDQKSILVKDDSGIFSASPGDHGSLKFQFSDKPLDELKESYAADGYNLLVYIPPFPDMKATEHRVTYYAAEKPSISMLERIEDTIADVFREHKIAASEIDRSLYDSFRTSIDLETDATTSDGKSAGSGKMASILGTALGGIMGILMYMVILIYGQMVMRSVMEEKISRIAEVMISSVKPFQLMLGKILAVGAVGLTQLAIWMVLIPTILAVISAFGPGGAETLATSQQSAEAMQQIEQSGIGVSGLIEEIFRLNWLVIIPSFIVLFLGGYFIYSSLFAAIGSAVDEDLGEAQQFMLPVMLPVILGFVIAMSSIENPNSSVAVFGSLFPLTSPVVMPTRLPFDPPIWHIVLSLVILILTTLGIVWLSARIYRVGILMYGKKITFKELGRWLFYK